MHLELGIGIVVGIAVRLSSAQLIAPAARRKWIHSGGRRVVTLAAALGRFALAVTLSGNGYIAAFAAGIAFGAAFPRDIAAATSISR